MEFSFRDKTYKLETTERFAQDPSWFSHVDEAGVRDRDWLVGEGDIVLDIGSAYGSYALTALAVGAARIICFNPNAEENGYLRKSLALNGWQDRCEIIEKGLYSKTGWLNDMSQAFSENEVPGSFAVWAFDDLELSVPSGVPLWVKLDVEGAEVEVLKGMTKFIGGFRPVLLIENHQFKDASIQTRVEVELARHGYTAVSHHPYHGVSHSLYRPGAGG